MGRNDGIKKPRIQKQSTLQKHGEELQLSTKETPCDDYETFRTVVENSNDGVVIARGGKRLYFNRKHAELLGYADIEEFARLPLYCTVHPDDRDMVMDYAQRRQKGEPVPSRYELRFIRKDGSIAFMELSSTLIRYDGGPASLAFVRDIAERKRMEEELQNCWNGLAQMVAERTEELEKSDKKYRDLVENALTGIYQSTLSGEILYANDTLWNMLGYETREEYVAAGVIATYKNPADRQALIDKLKETGSFRGHEIQLITKTGQPLTVLASGAIEGDVISGMLMDITEQKRSAMLLRASEERYRALLDNAGDPIFITDPEGNFLEANKAAENLLGYRKEELLRMNFRQIHPEEELEGVTRSFREMQEGRLHIGRDIKVLKKDGTLVPVDITGNAVRYAGKIELQGIFRDISERKKNEQELQVKNKTLEELNIALKVLLRQTEETRREVEDRFVSNVKELVLRYTEKIRRGRLDADQKGYLTIIEQNLNEIISPFLHTLKQLNLTPRETQVASFIKDGKTSKEIGQIIGVAPSAVDAYRNNIRHKLNISNKKLNLRSYLQSMG